VQQNTNEPECSTKPDCQSHDQSAALQLSTRRKTAADVVMKSRSPSNQAILTDLEVSVTAPKPKRQGDILKDATNRTGNEINAKKSVNLPAKTSRLNQKAHDALASSKLRKGKENTQADEDMKSSAGVSDVDSDMMTVPTSNGNAALDSSFDSASSWNYEKAINGWQSFYDNYTLPPTSAILESQISTPVTKNTSRKNSHDDSFVINKKHHKPRGSRTKKDEMITPPHHSHSGNVAKNTDASYEDSDLNGCFDFDQIKSALSLFSPNSVICSMMQE
jgi:hypothetical protein